MKKERRMRADKGHVNCLLEELENTPGHYNNIARLIIEGEVVPVEFAKMFSKLNPEYIRNLVNIEELNTDEKIEEFLWLVTVCEVCKWTEWFPVN